MLAILLALAAPLAQATEIAVEEVTKPGLRVLKAALPGEIRASLAEASSWLLLVHRPDAPTTQLVRFEPARAGLEVLREDLPEESDSLALKDLDGDGELELLLGSTGGIVSLGPWRRPDRQPESWLASPGLSLRNLRARDLLGSPGDDLSLALPSSGRLEFRSAAGRRVVPLPTKVRRTPSGLTITSPPVHRLDGYGWVAGPETHGTTRLRSRLISQTGGEPVDAWSRFPTATAIETASYDLLDGQPMLLVTSYRGDKFGIFDQQKVSVFTLGEDRTRAGQGPRFEIETKSHRWQPCEARLIDLDGDERRDLMLFHLKGLDGDELLVDGHPGRGGGRFAPRRQRSSFDITALAWSYERDYTADGELDLVVLGSDRVDLYAGVRPGPKGKRLFEREATWSYPLGEALEEIEASVTVGSDGADGEISAAGTLALSAETGSGPPGLLIGLEGSSRLIYLEPEGSR